MTILVVDDQWELIQPGLEAVLPDCRLAYAATGEEGLAKLRSNPDIGSVLLDVRMPPELGEENEDRVGLGILRQITQESPDVPVVMHTCIHDDPELIQEARELGAYWYVAKSSSGETLQKRVRSALAQFERRKKRKDKRPLDQMPRVSGHSKAAQRADNLLRKVAPSEETVLLLGETGTGKELAARAIHWGSPRRGKRFQVVDCANLKGEMLQVTLWGSARGAYTGAIEREGAFEAADGGTVFLDEIGELPLAEQVALLRVLQSKEVARLGDNDYRRVDVRIVAASNRDLAEMIRTGAFRDDLYERLNVLTVRLPPLRECRDDLPALADHFLTKCSPEGVPAPSLTPEALGLLVSYSWPRNIRQLENTIRRALILADGPEIGVEHFDLEPDWQADDPKGDDTTGLRLSLMESGLNAFAHEKGRETLQRVLAEAVKEFGGIKEAGEVLGLFGEGREKQDYDLLRVWCRRLSVRAKGP